MNTSRPVDSHYFQKKIFYEHEDVRQEYLKNGSHVDFYKLLNPDQYPEYQTERNQFLAVFNDRNYISYIENPCEDAQLEAIFKNPFLIGDIQVEPTEKVKWLAIFNNSICVGQIKNASDEQQLYAVTHNSNAIKFINNPPDYLIDLAIKDNPDIMYSIRYKILKSDHLINAVKNNPERSILKIAYECMGGCIDFKANKDKMRKELNKIKILEGLV